MPRSVPAPSDQVHDADEEPHPDEPGDEALRHGANPADLEPAWIVGRLEELDVGRHRGDRLVVEVEDRHLAGAGEHRLANRPRIDGGQRPGDRVFKDFDIILAPTSPTTAYKSGEKIKDPLAMYMGDIFTVFANLTGIPAVSLPLFNHSNALPYGVQAMANRFDEVSLLSFSHQLMQ